MNGARGSSRYFSATPTVVLASSAVALMHVRAWREVPLKSTSSAVAALGDATWTRYSSPSSTPSQSAACPQPSHAPSGIVASASAIRSALASQT